MYAATSGLFDAATVPLKFLSEKNDTIAGLVVVPAVLFSIVTVTLLVGTVAGAVYTPVASIVPVAADPPDTPFTFQTELPVLPPPLPVAVNCTCCPASTMILLGDKLKFAGCSKVLVGDEAPPHPDSTAAVMNTEKRIKNRVRFRLNEIPRFAVLD